MANTMRLPYRFGRYTLVEKIANGGTAEVYRALLTADEGFSKTVAVKRLLPSWGGDGEIERMLIDEARALTHLQHQSIAQVFELGRSEGIPFLAMEFVDGIDCARLLLDLMRDGSPLPTAHALYIIGQVLTALEFAHRTADADGRPLCIVHRDISPSNILLSWNGEVKVTDFGIAKGLHRTRETAVGTLKGKYAYMAPEQARGEAVDARADLFACGIVLYELLSARRLFDASSDLEVLEKVKCASIPEEVLRGFSPELRTVLILSLAPEADRRYQSAQEMLSDVQRFAISRGEIGSSLDLAAYLRERFPIEGRAPRAEAHALKEEPGTKVMGCIAEKVRWRGAARILRAAGTAIFLSASVLLQPAPLSSHGQEVAAAAPEPAPILAAPVPQARVRPSAPPGLHGGVVAIDSEPAGASGTLSLGGEKRQVTAPFSVDGIDIGDGVDGRIELGAPGFEAHSQAFHLTPSLPAFVSRIALKKQAQQASISINARPWGLVDVPGYASGRESPVNSLKLKAGSYLIRVRHPPSGQTASGRIVVADGEAKRCIASFGPRPELRCR
ncbi:MAG: serine/threonine-protein kinase [Pseudomonadota bacterium]